jgi:hypothetical protein
MKEEVAYKKLMLCTNKALDMPFGTCANKDKCVVFNKIKLCKQ